MTPTATISTHVLDTALGAPASAIAVTLYRVSEGSVTELGRGTTDADGRVASFGVAVLQEGTHRLCFEVASYFAETRRASFYSEICIAFEVAAVPQHYHVPLLLSPYGYSTYRGS
ncbi:MAG: hydroxyisourate hydrolase [Gemmatimonadota bacterium]|nr:hydroxyisourate hydrolase [Gemmatimonadota bacterium]